MSIEWPSEDADVQVFRQERQGEGMRIVWASTEPDMYAVQFRTPRGIVRVEHSKSGRLIVTSLRGVLVVRPCAGHEDGSHPSLLIEDESWAR